MRRNLPRNRKFVTLDGCGRGGEWESRRVRFCRKKIKKGGGDEGGEKGAATRDQGRQKTRGFKVDKRGRGRHIVQGGGGKKEEVSSRKGAWHVAPKKRTSRRSTEYGCFRASTRTDHGRSGERRKGSDSKGSVKKGKLDIKFWLSGRKLVRKNREGKSNT